MTLVDARGERCPMPVIRLAKVAAQAHPGEQIVVLATDPAARADISAWSRMRGHTLVEIRDEAEHTAYVVIISQGPLPSPEPAAPAPSDSGSSGG
jgi:tRNA 2-thiouridine synthesizing protein A